MNDIIPEVALLACLISFLIGLMGGRASKRTKQVPQPLIESVNEIFTQRLHRIMASEGSSTSRAEKLSRLVTEYEELVLRIETF